MFKLSVNSGLFGVCGVRLRHNTVSIRSVEVLQLLRGAERVIDRVHRKTFLKLHLLIFLLNLSDDPLPGVCQLQSLPTPEITLVELYPAIRKDFKTARTIPNTGMVSRSVDTEA